MSEIGYDAQGRPVMASDNRTCAGCGTDKPPNEFRIVSGYRLRTCRSCESRARREREAREPLE